MKSPEINPIQTALGFIRDRKSDLLLLGASLSVATLGFRFLPEVIDWRNGIENANKASIALTCDNLLTLHEEEHGLLDQDTRNQALTSCQELSWRQVERNYDDPFTQPHRLASAGFIVWRIVRLTQPALRPLRVL